MKLHYFEMSNQKEHWQLKEKHAMEDRNTRIHWLLLCCNVQGNERLWQLV